MSEDQIALQPAQGATAVGSLGVVLVVDESRLVGELLKASLAAQSKLQIISASTLQQARELISLHEDRLLVAVVGRVLRDAPNGEVVDYVCNANIPAIVLTASWDLELRTATVSQRNVVDYVLKNSPDCIEQVATLITRIERNQSIGVVVVDAEKQSRSPTVHWLQALRLKVYEAESGEQALAMLSKNAEIKLVVTDFNTRSMDGVQLATQIRRKFRRQDIAIVGIADQADRMVSARFIKAGANDFMHRPFLEEEFACRVIQNIDLIETLQALRDAAIRDPLTGLHNRRYLFDAGEAMLASAQRGQVALTLAVIDLDFFKRINDTMGHDAGDEALRQAAKLLRSAFRKTDIVARIGGEEFCVLAVNMAPEAAAKVFESVRSNLADLVIRVDDYKFQITASFGVISRFEGAMAEAIKQADELLYQAKERGRNCVVLQSDIEAK
jgi:diguanylate cyclase (GGDEF)-like protein